MQRLPARRVVRWMCLTVIAATATAASNAQEQTPAAATPSSDADVKFEVASVKKSPPTPNLQGVRFGLQPSGRFAIPGMPVSSLITMAYGIQRFQVIGGPGWVNTYRFDINAIEEDLPIPPSVPGMTTHMQLLLRSLLKERFALVIHNETRELTLSYLVMAREDRKLGERLRPATVDCRALMAERAKAIKEGAPPPPLKPGEIP